MEIISQGKRKWFRNLRESLKFSIDGALYSVKVVFWTLDIVCVLLKLQRSRKLIFFPNLLQDRRSIFRNFITLQLCLGALCMLNFRFSGFRRNLALVVQLLPLYLLN